MTKELKKLAEEARKYKSAEGFVKNFNILTEEDLKPRKEAYHRFTEKFRVRGVKKSKKYQLLNEFEREGRKLAEKIAERLGYNLNNLQYKEDYFTLRNFLKDLYDVNHYFDLSAERLMHQIRVAILDTQLAKKDIINFYNQVIK